MRSGTGCAFLATLAIGWGVAAPGGAGAAPVEPDAPATLRICADNNDWLPFTYLDPRSGEPTGVHIDLLTRALGSLGYSVSIEALPWRRCLEQAARGGFDAVASASYTQERAREFAYPPGAGETEASPWRLSQVNYVLVTYVDDPYRYDGHWQGIPEPARVPRGYSLAAELREAGIEVDEAPGDRNNYLKLLRDRDGVVVTTLGSALAYSKHGRTAGKLRIHDDPPLRSKSYFVVFPVDGRIAPEERQRIWERVAQFREEPGYLDALLENHASAGVVDD